MGSTAITILALAFIVIVLLTPGWVYDLVHKRRRQARVWRDPNTLHWVAQLRDGTLCVYAQPFWVYNRDGRRVHPDIQRVLDQKQCAVEAIQDLNLPLNIEVPK